MGTAVFVRADSRLKSWSRWDDIPHDDGIEVKLTLSSSPNRETDRWDGATGVRPATQPELDAAKDAKSDEVADGFIDDVNLRALMQILVQRIPSLDTPTLLRTAVRDRIRQIHRNES